MDEAAKEVAAVPDNAYATVLDLDADRRELLVRQGVGWDEGIVGTPPSPRTTTHRRDTPSSRTNR